jgi:hypothetical protein
LKAQLAPLCLVGRCRRSVRTVDHPRDLQFRYPITTFNDRDAGFERKFALDEEQEFRAGARRNRLLGEWAAGLMGLESADDYAKAVVKSDFEQPGDEDVLRKVFGDLKSAGVDVSESAVRRKMDELLGVAREQIANG